MMAMHGTSAEIPMVRASQWTNRLRWLEKVGHMNAVRAHLGPQEYALLDSPPLVSSWLPFERTQALDCAIERVGGLSLVRTAGVETVRLGMPVFAPLIDGFVRLFGLTPETFFTRMQSFATVTTKGIFYAYEKSGPRAGVMKMSLPAARRVEYAFFVSGAGSMSTTFETCALPNGTIADPEWIDPAVPNAVLFRIRW